MVIFMVSQFAEDDQSSLTSFLQMIAYYFAGLLWKSVIK